MVASDKETKLHIPGGPRKLDGASFAWHQRSISNAEDQADLLATRPSEKQPMNGWDGQTCRGGWRSAPGQRVLAGGALLLRATSNPLSRPPPCPAKSQPLQRRPPPRPFRFTNQNFREARHHLLPSRPLHHLDNWSRYPSHAIATAQLEFFLYRPSTSRQWQLAMFHPLLTKLPYCVQVFPTSLPHVDISLIARGLVHEFC